MKGVSAESFNYRQKPANKTTRRRIPTAVKAKLKAPLTQTVTVTQPKVPIDQQLDLLQAYRIYVDHKLGDYRYYEQLSMALGATVVQDPKEGISILVHGPKDSKGRVSKLANNAMENHVHVVAPAWLKECYVSQTFQSPHLFPCDYNEKTRLIKETIHQDDNPFGLGVDVLDSIVSQPVFHDIPKEEEKPSSPEPEVRGIEVRGVETSKESTPSRSSTPRQSTPREPITDNARVRELLIRKRKEKEEREKAEGATKKPKKDGTLPSFFGNSSKMTIRYGESSRNTSR